MRLADVVAIIIFIPFAILVEYGKYKHLKYLEEKDSYADFDT